MIVVSIIIGLAALITAVTVIWKKVLKPIIAWFKKINRGMDSLLGYPEVLDRDGSVLKEETPMLAKRVRAVEEAVLALTENTKALTDWARRLDYLERQVAAFLTWQKEHEALHTVIAETKAAQDHTQVVVNTAAPEKTGNT